MPIIDLLLPEYDREIASTRKMLERVPDDKLGWKPHPKSMRPGAPCHPCRHAAWTGPRIRMTKDSFDFMPPGKPPYNPPKASSNAELLAMLDKSAAEARAALAGATDEKSLPAVVAAGRRTRPLHYAADSVHPRHRDEPPHPSSRATFGVPAAAGRSDARNVRPVGRRSEPHRRLAAPLTRSGTSAPAPTRPPAPGRRSHTSAGSPWPARPRSSPACAARPWSSRWAGTAPAAAPTAA